MIKNYTDAMQLLVFTKIAKPGLFSCSVVPRALFISSGSIQSQVVIPNLFQFGGHFVLKGFDDRRVLC